MSDDRLQKRAGELLVDAMRCKSPLALELVLQGAIREGVSLGRMEREELALHYSLDSFTEQPPAWTHEDAARLEGIKAQLEFRGINHHDVYWLLQLSSNYARIAARRMSVGATR